MPRAPSNPYRAARRRLELSTYRCFELRTLLVSVEDRYKETVRMHERANDALEDAEVDFKEISRRTTLALRQEMQKSVRDGKVGMKAVDRQLRDKYDEREAVLWEVANRFTKGCEALGRPCDVHDAALKIWQKRGRKPGLARIENARLLRSRNEEDTERRRRERLEAMEREARRKARHPSEPYEEAADDLEVLPAVLPVAFPAGSPARFEQSNRRDQSTPEFDATPAILVARAHSPTSESAPSTGRTLSSSSICDLSQSEGEKRIREPRADSWAVKIEPTLQPFCLDLFPVSQLRHMDATVYGGPSRPASSMRSITQTQPATPGSSSTTSPTPSDSFKPEMVAPTLPVSPSESVRTTTQESLASQKTEQDTNMTQDWAAVTSAKLEALACTPALKGETQSDVLASKCESLLAIPHVVAEVTVAPVVGESSRLPAPAVYLAHGSTAGTPTPILRRSILPADYVRARLRAASPPTDDHVRPPPIRPLKKHRPPFRRIVLPKEDKYESREVENQLEGKKRHVRANDGTTLEPRQVTSVDVEA